MQTNSKQLSAIKNSLLSAFIGDAMAMPLHWYYKPESIDESYGGPLKTPQFVKPAHPHPEAFFVGMSYKPDVKKAKELDRSYDILGDKAKFYRTTYSEFEFETNEREAGHGNATVKKAERYHYHTGLEAGELTFAGESLRMLLQSVNDNDGYDEKTFLDDWIKFNTSGDIRDAYREIFVRRWFETYSTGVAPAKCAARQRDVWSIGSSGGVVRPLALSMLAPTSYQGVGFAVEHAYLTHDSHNVAASLGVLVPLLHQLLRVDGDIDAAILLVADAAATMRVPQITGEQLYATYREHDGPGNIPDDEMWSLHTDLAHAPFDVLEWAEKDESEVVNKRLATVCYTEHSVPLALYFVVRYRFDVGKAVLASTNAGGDNVHRSIIVGLLCGAVSAPSEALVDGLKQRKEIVAQVDAFAKKCLRESEENF